MDDGEKRKRKIDNVSEHEEDDDDKMNKFFALIRSTRQIRQQIHKPPPPAAAAAAARVWNPTFVAEDFIDPRLNPFAIGSSKTAIDTESEAGLVANREKMGKVVEKEEEEENENVKEERELLDLNLSLW